jgi:hypothetical protein
MNAAFRVGLVLLSVGIIGYATVDKWRQPEPPKPCEPETVSVLTGGVKLAYLNDDRVKALFAKQCLNVKTEKSGVLADDLSKTKSMDAAWPVGANMAEDYAKLGGTQVPLATTVLGIASWKKVADQLVANGYAHKEKNHYVLSLPKFLPDVLASKKWSEMKDNKELSIDKPIVISMPHVRTSQTTLQAMLQFSYVMNNNTMLQDAKVAAKLAEKLYPLMARQGFQENTQTGPFEDYLASSTAGRIPLVLAYESQFIEGVTNKRITDRHTFLYMEPALTIKHTWVSYTPKGAKMAEVLQSIDAQKIAAEYGLRTTRPAVFDEYIAKVGRTTAYLDSQVDLPPAQVIQELNKTIVAKMLNP